MFVLAVYAVHALVAPTFVVYRWFWLPLRYVTFPFTWITTRLPGSFPAFAVLHTRVLVVPRSFTVLVTHRLVRLHAAVTVWFVRFTYRLVAHCCRFAHTTFAFCLFSATVVGYAPPTRGLVHVHYMPALPPLRLPPRTVQRHLCLPLYAYGLLRGCRSARRGSCLTVPMPVTVYCCGYRATHAYWITVTARVRGCRTYLRLRLPPYARVTVCLYACGYARSAFATRSRITRFVYVAFTVCNFVCGCHAGRTRVLLRLVTHHVTLPHHVTARSCTAPSRSALFVGCYGSTFPFLRLVWLVPPLYLPHSSGSHTVWLPAPFYWVTLHAFTHHAGLHGYVLPGLV